MNYSGDDAAVLFTSGDKDSDNLEDKPDVF